MFSVFPNRKNYCLYFTVCDLFFKLPNVFSSNVRSSKYLIITELICSNAQRLELLECSNFSKNRIVRMLKLLNAQKLELLNVRIAQMLDLLNAQSPPPKKCSKSPVPCKNSKFKNSKLRQSRNNSKFKIQKSSSHLLHLVNVSVERSAMFELQRTHGGSKLARLCYALAL